jgi:broad specificity phosphatase PhoE
MANVRSRNNKCNDFRQVVAGELRTLPPSAPARYHAAVMRKLILVKHCPPEVVPDVPSERWHLSEKGRAPAIPLAEALRPHAPTVIVSSEEPKAAETAQLIANRLNVSWHPAPGLHEHDRSNVPHMRSGEFISLMELFFRKPGEHVLGRETADQARARFQSAVDHVLDKHPDGNVAVVSHGTVIALMLEGKGKRSPFEVWRAMGLPSIAVLSVPELALESTTDRIA